MQRISVILTELNYNNDLHASRNKNYALQKPFKTDFSSQLFVICSVGQAFDYAMAQGTRFCTITYFFM